MNKITNNAMKVAYLVKKYPEHSVAQIIELLAMPAIEINTAMWEATDQDWINDPDLAKVDGPLGPKTPPEHWDFGTELNELMDMILYSFRRLARKEHDLEENYLSNWTMGYKAMDVMIAMSVLLERGHLGTYQLTDPKDKESVYTFYTLAGNVDKQWGRANFKVQPKKTEVAKTEE